MEIQKINDNIYYLIFIATFGSISLALSVIFFYIRYHKKFQAQQAALQKAELQHRQQLLNATILSQEKERMRISKDLHDHIGSSLSNLRFMASHIQAETNIPVIRTITEEYKKNIDLLVNDIRNISHSLSPAGLALWGFHESLEEFCDKTSTNAGLQIEILDDTGGILRQLPFDLALSLFRVMQELVSNTIKHAAAKSVTIATGMEQNYISVKYTDDGRGTDTNIFSGSGIGMYNIQSRLSMIQATYNAVSAAGKGFSFHIRLPQAALDKSLHYE